MEANNCATKCFHKDKSNAFTIVAFFDIEEALTDEFITDYVTKLTESFPILRHVLLEKDDHALFFHDQGDQFRLEDYSSIVRPCSDFEQPLRPFLNAPFDERRSKWQLLWCVDPDAGRTRGFFKIHHAYADGYRIIEMLTAPLSKEIGAGAAAASITDRFQRQSGNRVWYWFVGTLLLLWSNLRLLCRALFNSFFTVKSTAVKRVQTDFIQCKPLDFVRVKEFTKRANITVNDFLYALMIKADALYHGRKKPRTVFTCSPVNVSRTTQLNNMCPVFNRVDNSLDNESLFAQVHETFNQFKYSLFIPFLSFLIEHVTPYINTSKLASFYNDITTYFDYIFTNMIGPRLDALTKPVTNIVFLCTAKDREITYNAISSGCHINLVISFKEGVITDKQRFQRAIEKAYKDLMNTLF